MNTEELLLKNQPALFQAEILDKSQHHTVQQLLALPPYYGFVNTPHNFVMFLGGNDDGVALRFFYGQPFEAYSIPIWKALCANSKFIVDVGGHTGVYALVSATSSKADVWTFEPFLPNFSRLLLNVRANNINRVLAIPSAASNQVGNVSFAVDSSLWYLSSGGHIGQGKKNTINVSTTTLDSFIPSTKRVDLIKIDTEGHESLVLQGAVNLLKRDLPTIMFENNGDPSIEGAEQFLESLGYIFFAIDDQAKTLTVTKHTYNRGSEYQRNYIAACRPDHLTILEDFQ